MPAKSRFLAFHGQRVHFRVAMPEAELKHRLFMLSSPLSSTFNWRKLLPELTQLGCMVVLMDLPGFGEGDSGPEISQSNEIRANIAWGVLDQLDQETGSDLSLWHLVGHGTACLTVLAMANAYPDSVRSQVHVAPTLESALMPRPRRAADLNRAAEKWYDRNILNPDGFRRFIDASFARPAEDYVRDHMHLCLTRPGARESFLRMLHGSGTPEPAMGFSPTMLLWGGQDALTNEETQAEFLRLLPEAERHQLRSAGHFPMETHSKAMRDYLRGWLRYTD